MIAFDPYLVGDVQDGVPGNPIAFLAHELAHAYDVNNGLLPDASIYEGGPSNSSWHRACEVSAGNRENEFRKWLQFPQRKYYHYQDSNGTIENWPLKIFK